jgi:aspartate/glutamate racemase
MIVQGGHASYGHVAGILMSDSTIPRVPGDPGHAATFGFPVIHEVLTGFPFQDLVDIDRQHADILISCARRLEHKGVKFVAADCGLFAPFQKELNHALDIPFIGSAIDLIPLLQHHCPEHKKAGIITGDTRILKPAHLIASGVDPDSVIISGMEESKEFNRVIIEQGQTLDVEQMRQGVAHAAEQLSGNNVGFVILECTNLISYRTVVQQVLNTPVFDLVTLIEFYASGFMKRQFHTRFI